MLLLYEPDLLPGIWSTIRVSAREAEDLAAPFEDAFVQVLKLFGGGRYELTGVGEARD